MQYPLVHLKGNTLDYGYLIGVSCSECKVTVYYKHIQINIFCSSVVNALKFYNTLRETMKHPNFYEIDIDEYTKPNKA